MRKTKALEKVSMVMPRRNTPTKKLLIVLGRVTMPLRNIRISRLPWILCAWYMTQLSSHPVAMHVSLCRVTLVCDFCLNKQLNISGCSADTQLC